MNRWMLLAIAVVACKGRPDEAGGGKAGGGKANEKDLAPRPRFVEPVALAVDQPGPSAVAVDTTHLYWTHFGKALVRRMPRTGGPIETIYEGASEIGGMSIGLDADGVYFLEGFSVKRVPKAGGAARDLGTIDSLPAVLVADADGAYTITDGSVTRYPRDGSASRLAGDYEIWDVAVDATHVYWVARAAVKRIAKTGGAVEILATGMFRWADLAVSDTDVYWGDAVLQSVFSVPKAGGPVRFVAHAWSIATKDIAVDRGVVWVLQSMGKLERIDPSTGAVTSMTSTLGSAGAADVFMGLALAGDDVYIANGAQHLVGAGPVHIDLTQPNPTLPTYRYDGTVLRVGMAPPADPIVEHATRQRIASVWFEATTIAMQDANNAVRWIDELDEALVTAVRTGTQGLQLVAALQHTDDATARARAALVESTIRSRLGGTPRITTVVDAGEVRGDVEVDLDLADLVARMRPSQ